MDAYEAPLLGSFLKYAEKNELASLPAFLFFLAKDLLLPVVVGIFGTMGVASVLFRAWRIVVPPPVGVLHRQAKLQYRAGQTEKALEEWAKLKTFGPAYLSRAVHALYVEWDAQRTLQILRLAKEAKVKVKLSQVEMIRMDAKAIQAGGNRIMVDMNARIAKQEYLGINSI